MSGGGLLSVAQARARILSSVPAGLPVETIPLECASGRTLARDLVAQLTQPPQAMSAMDGYAVRTEDLARLPVKLKQIGESRAGHGFQGAIGLREAVRIFTGAPVPEGCDTILVQEKARVEAGFVEPLEAVAAGRNIRVKGIDFSEGEVLLAVGTRLGPSNIALAAAMNFAKVAVTKRPRVAILATGDELVRPGETIGPDQIIASNSFSVAALIETAGGEPFDLGIAKDELSALENGIAAARDAGADLLVTLGGASVGDHDLVKPALAKQGMELNFWKIAMRPGKPVIHGRLGPMSILGLPGNPVAAFVAGLVFLVPLVRALSGDPNAGGDHSEAAVLGVAVRGNDSRQDYLRATLRPGEAGLPVATPFDLQDSSVLRILAQSQCLVVREPHAPPAAAGDLCRIIKLGP
ncbi:molybdopterin molybdotransferase MoeA [Methylocapsa sp. D3K7]|uniref:molybdopterin molybdotransferase MoeA n=1 Tax=Methylocapsa sp. D3K7 TaxID=3041435 RepID=UPI00244E8406|nr:gephyrin-like molybdotransferase Glp [Methylocapsa sp. D3K7]WGJ13812.1 molybdopterin molybdotransferase MoeA [Methylocapsa sp. D3K7]